jgi:hypothetical protein
MLRRQENEFILSSYRSIALVMVVAVIAMFAILLPTAYFIDQLPKGPTLLKAWLGTIGFALWAATMALTLVHSYGGLKFALDRMDEDR